MIAEDPHGGWERLLPIWEAKEPAIVAFLKVRVALPLFFERALIEITPRRVPLWPAGEPPRHRGHDPRRGGRVMRLTPRATPAAGLGKLAGYPFHILTWVADDGYPVSAVAAVTFDAALPGPALITPPSVGLVVPRTASCRSPVRHIRPQPGYGYDQRRHVTVWGSVTPSDGGTLTLTATDAWGWDEAETPFFEYSERSTGQSKRHFDALSSERGTPVKPKLALPFLVLRTTRLPFLTATIVPVLVGIVIAALPRSVRPPHGRADDRTLCRWSTSTRGRLPNRPGLDRCRLLVAPRRRPACGSAPEPVSSVPGRCRRRP